MPKTTKEDMDQFGEKLTKSLDSNARDREDYTRSREVARPAVDIDAELQRTRAQLEQVQAQRQQRISDAQAATLAAKGNALMNANRAMAASGPSVGGGMSDAEAARLAREAEIMRVNQQAAFAAPPAVQAPPPPPPPPDPLEARAEEMRRQYMAMYGAPSPLQGKY